MPPEIPRGRPPAVTLETIAHARALLTRPEATVSSIARLLDVSLATVYKHIPEITASGRPPGQQARPGVTAGAR